MGELISIKQWSKEDRPRERLLSKGRTALSEAELIAILIGSGNKGETAVELSKRILVSVDNKLNSLGKLSINDLTKFKGIGEAKAVSIVAALELGRRRKESKVEQKAKIQSSKDAYEIMKHLLEDLPYEEFWVLVLNRQNKVLDKICISKGGVSGTVADVRLIFKPAIEKLASGIILFHNHPSGNLDPSSSDIALTNKMIDAGKTLDIPILDHLIIGDNNYYSFADNGLI
jgi:DNA repair protein RadC